MTAPWAGIEWDTSPQAQSTRWTPRRVPPGRPNCSAATSAVEVLASSSKQAGQNAMVNPSSIRDVGVGRHDHQMHGAGNRGNDGDMAVLVDHFDFVGITEASFADFLLHGYGAASAERKLYQIVGNDPFALTLQGMA